MVKANIQINYYTALELPGDATLEDIKKNYRKLALKYHPDRGGAVEKFQAIQAAHEVLEDPVTKAKYDADRRRAGLIPPTYTNARTATPTAKPTPYPYAGGTYPPPPRRPPPQTSATTGAGWRPAGTATGSGTTGADRFNNFPSRPAPTSKRETDKANVFTAWQNMNQAKKDAAARDQQDKDAAAGQRREHREQQPHQHPRPQPKGAFGASPQKPRPPPLSRADTRYPTEEDIRAGTSYRPAPTASWTDGTAWSDFKESHSAKPGMGRSNTTKTPRKTGFDPLSGGDEGQAGSTSNYSSSRFRTRSDDTRAFPPPPSPASRGNGSTAPVDDDVVFVDSVPRKTPYSSHIGQQKYTSSDNLPGNPAAPPQPARTTPPKKAQTRNGTARRPFIVEDSSDESNSDAESSATTPENNAQPKPNFSSNPFTAQDTAQSKPDLSNNPFAARPIRNPVAPSSRTASPFNKQTASDQHPQQPAGDGKTNMYEPLFPDLPLRASAVRSASLPRPKPVDSWAGLGNWAIPSSVAPKSRKNSLAPQADDIHASKNTAEPFPTTGTVPTSKRQWKKEKRSQFGKFNIPPFVNSTSNPGDSRFNVDTSMFSSSKPTRSEEKINTAFTPEQWAGTFSANNVFAAQAPTRKTASPTRKSSRIHQSSNSNLRSASKTAPNGPPPPFAQYAGFTSETASEAPASPPQPPVKFSADEWAKTMKDSSWAFQPDVLKADATSSGSSRPSSSKGNRKASVKVPGVKIPATMPKPATATTVEEEDARHNNTYDAEAVAPQQSETGASDDMMDIDMGEAPPPPKDYTASTAHKKEPKFVKVDASKLRQSSEATPSSESNNNVDNPSLNANLADLTSVLTQPTTGAGLSDLADVASTLPFSSRPSSSTTPHITIPPRPLDLPKLPVAPGAPVKLTRYTWRRHCDAFAKYMAKYHDFDKAMTTHFTLRRDFAAEVVRKGAQELESVGGVAWTEYCRAQEEDQRVRVHWGIGCDRHLEAVREFEAVRGRVRSLVEGPGLAE